ncbi:hypothetical protein O181_007744 [Austropuccinia psidii MF-1]|uniref:Peregrin n=1 Tax=Austropuccinia psidii MF-1 TaxID=1389203 RepID=A0A9Q3BLG2_9BASI|nr:hypothetical protein [Austropuccinia psidii MF-1]
MGGGHPILPLQLPKLDLPKVSFKVILPTDDSAGPGDSSLKLDLSNKHLVNYGYNSSNFWEPPASYIRWVQPAEEELERQCEYDMDEQDREWLKGLNLDRKRVGHEPVSCELFEIVMDRLEKEWFQLNRKLLQPDANLMTSEDSRCAICEDGDTENSNAIVFCDGCNLAVHQDCYGVPYIPEGQWLCRKCTVSPDRPVACELCPNSFGAFKQTAENKWAHLICAIHIPETGVGNAMYMEPIDGIRCIPKQRWKLKCYICKKGTGACIQCANRACCIAYHVTCAQESGLYLKIKPSGSIHSTSNSHDQNEIPNGSLADQIAPEGINPSRSFCDKHTPKGHIEALQAAAKARATSLHTEAKLLPSTTALNNSNCSSSEHGSPQPSGNPNSALLTMSPKKINSLDQLCSLKLLATGSQTVKSARAYRKTYSSGPPLVPELIFQRLLEYLNKLRCVNKKAMLNMICKYWSLKREVRRGAPLLKRLHLEPWTASNPSTFNNEEDRRRKYGLLVAVRHDLQQVKNLAAIICKREKVKLRKTEVQKEVIQKTLFPLYQRMLGVLNALCDADKQKYFLHPVSALEVPDYHDVIKHPMDWSTIQRKLEAYEYFQLSEFISDIHLTLTNARMYNHASTPYHKAAVRIGKLIEPLLRELAVHEPLSAIAGCSSKSFPNIQQKTHFMNILSLLLPECIDELLDAQTLLASNRLPYAEVLRGRLAKKVEQQPTPSPPEAFSPSPINVLQIQPTCDPKKVCNIDHHVHEKVLNSMPRRGRPPTRPPKAIPLSSDLTLHKPMNITPIQPLVAYSSPPSSAPVQFPGFNHATPKPQNKKHKQASLEVIDSLNAEFRARKRSTPRVKRPEEVAQEALIEQQHPHATKAELKKLKLRALYAPRVAERERGMTEEEKARRRRLREYARDKRERGKAEATQPLVTETPHPLPEGSQELSAPGSQLDAPEELSSGCHVACADERFENSLQVASEEHSYNEAEHTLTPLTFQNFQQTISLPESYAISNCGGDLQKVSPSLSTPNPPSLNSTSGLSHVPLSIEIQSISCHAQQTHDPIVHAEASQTDNNVFGSGNLVPSSNHSHPNGLNQPEEEGRKFNADFASCSTCQASTPPPSFVTAKASTHQNDLVPTQTIVVTIQHDQRAVELNEKCQRDHSPVKTLPCDDIPRDPIPSRESIHLEDELPQTNQLGTLRTNGEIVVSPEANEPSLGQTFTDASQVSVGTQSNTPKMDGDLGRSAIACVEESVIASRSTTPTDSNIEAFISNENSNGAVCFASDFGLPQFNPINKSVCLPESGQGWAQERKNGRDDLGIERTPFNKIFNEPSNVIGSLPDPETGDTFDVLLSNPPQTCQSIPEVKVTQELGFSKSPGHQFTPDQKLASLAPIAGFVYTTDTKNDLIEGGALSSTPICMNTSSTMSNDEGISFTTFARAGTMDEVSASDISLPEAPELMKESIEANAQAMVGAPEQKVEPYNMEDNPCITSTIVLEEPHSICGEHASQPLHNAEQNLPPIPINESIFQVDTFANGHSAAMSETATLELQGNSFSLEAISAGPGDKSSPQPVLKKTRIKVKNPIPPPPEAPISSASFPACHNVAGLTARGTSQKLRLILDPFQPEKNITDCITSTHEIEEAEKEKLKSKSHKSVGYNGPPQFLTNLPGDKDSFRFFNTGFILPERTRRHTATSIGQRGSSSQEPSSSNLEQIASPKHKRRKSRLSDPGSRSNSPVIKAMRLTVIHPRENEVKPSPPKNISRSSFNSTSLDSTLPTFETDLPRTQVHLASLKEDESSELSDVSSPRLSDNNKTYRKSMISSIDPGFESVQATRPRSPTSIQASTTSDSTPSYEESSDLLVKSPVSTTKAQTAPKTTKRIRGQRREDLEVDSEGFYIYPKAIISYSRNSIHPLAREAFRRLSRATRLPEDGEIEDGTLVWAKVPGHNWFPAEVGLPSHPLVPRSVLGKSANKKMEKRLLVMFFDHQHSWQWIPRQNTRYFGESGELDSLLSSDAFVINRHKLEEIKAGCAIARANMALPEDVAAEDEAKARLKQQESCEY